MPATRIKNLSGDLNIVLTQDQINTVLQTVLGPKGVNLAGIYALASDYCCVDASVASSVAGPFSSVASSVSVVGNEVMLSGLARSAVGPAAAGAPVLKTKITVPKKVKVK